MTRAVPDYKKMRIAVLMGGPSGEREVSLRSGAAMAAALRRQGCAVVEIDVDADVAQRLRKERAELAVIALHGRWGEDGAIQGLLEILGIPYTGSGILASALAMDKIVSKRFFQQHDVPTPRFAVLPAGAPPEPPAEMALPLVVKPPCEGSTLGVTVVRAAGAFAPAVAEARRYDAAALVEEFVPGADVTVGIFDDKPLPAIEIRPKGELYDYAAKYTRGMTEYLVPAPLPDAVHRRVQELAARVHALLGCQGCTRVDFRVTPSGAPYVLEINTIPGMTETSLLPKAAAAAGIEYDRLVGWIAQAALARRRSA
jgi:D-alanine-D-alanine ligase